MRNALLLVLSGLLTAGCSDTSQPLAPGDGVPVFAAGNGVVHRDVQEFITSSEGCILPWIDPTNPEIGANVDVWGTVARAYPDVFPTSTHTGTVTERPLADGTAEITVHIQARDVLVAARRLDLPYRGSAVFGYIATEWADHPPVLGNGTFRLTFVNTAPGAPLPGFCDVLFGYYDEGDPWKMSKLQITASATGPLRELFGVPEGTPGRLNLVQTARFLAQARGQGVADGFPAERITIQPIGR